jgi:HK97 family phage major capsid protein
MVMTRVTGAALLAPEQVDGLLITPVATLSIAGLISTVVRTSAPKFRIPLVTADPTASWVAEGAEISPSDMTVSELEITPSKLAGLSIITRELAQDTSPAAAEQVGLGLARDIARKLDAAYFGNTTANGPAGLGSLTTAVVTSGAAFTTDSFIDALAAAAAAGTTITNLVVGPTDFVAISKLKDTTGRYMLQPDPAKPGGRVVFGVPLVVSNNVASGTAWAIPQDRAYIVIRDDATIETDTSVFFTSDRVAVKATMRVGFGFPHPLGIVKITHT